jgi:hypothetical protein
MGGLLCASVYIYLCLHVPSIEYLLLSNMTLLDMLLLDTLHDNHPSRLIANPSSSPRTPLPFTLSPSPPLHGIGLRITPACATKPTEAPRFLGKQTQPNQVESGQGTLLLGTLHHQRGKTSLKKDEEEQRACRNEPQFSSPVSNSTYPPSTPVVVKKTT